MGCATGGGDPQLKQVGLCGNHAYSILECREVQSQTPTEGLVRLLRIRNPHGVGEWNGDWSDASAKWSGLLAHGLERTGVDDGTFWMDLTHFVMGFQLVDVCMAYRDWHARSFTNAFCARSSPLRVCRDVYRVRTRTKTTLYVSAMQPTRRGAWCRTDRKKSYKLGDVSLIVIQLDRNGQMSKVVGGGMHADSIGSRGSFLAHFEDPAAEYLVIAYSLGGPPSAAEVTKAQPFTVRFFASEPLQVCQQVFDESRDGELALTAFQSALMTLATRAPQPHEIPLRVKRRWQHLGLGRHVCVITCSGVVMLLAVNQGETSAVFEVQANVKVMIGRTAQGLLTSDDKAAENLNAAERQALKQNGGSRTERGGGFRWIAKWKHFRATCLVPGVVSDGQSIVMDQSRHSQRASPKGWQQVLMLLIPNGMQSQIGSLSCKLVPRDGATDPKPALANSSPKQKQCTLKGWFTANGEASGGNVGSGSQKARSLQKKQNDDNGVGGGQITSLFQPLPVKEETLRAMQTYSGCRREALGSENDDAALAAALAASRADAGLGGGEEAQLELALQASRAIAGEMEEEVLMREAMRASARDAELAEEEEKALMAAIAASEAQTSAAMRHSRDNGKQTVGYGNGMGDGRSGNEETVEIIDDDSDEQLRKAMLLSLQGRDGQSRKGVEDFSKSSGDKLIDVEDSDVGGSVRKRRSNDSVRTDEERKCGRKTFVEIDLCAEEDEVKRHRRMEEEEDEMTLEAIRQARLKRFDKGP
jgi:hypothetical protein